MKSKAAFAIAMIICVLVLPTAGSSETWSAPTWITELNSGSRDLEPWISADGKTLYFSSDRTGSLELYVSHRNADGLTWGAPERLPAPINDPAARDGHPSLTLDGHYMYFHSNRPSPYNTGAYGWYETDIWVSENINGVWQPPTVLGPAVNATSHDYAPYISVDGQLLIFASNRAGGFGAIDLYTSRKVNGVWQPAQNMGSPINNSSNQVHPSLSYTGRYLILSDLSNVYRSEWSGTAWQTPVKLPTIVNNCTTGTESSIYNDCTATLYYYKMCGPTGSWDMATAQWLDPPGPNPCDSLIIPAGQWRVRVTLTKASTVMKNDMVFIDSPISQQLLQNKLKNVGAVVYTPFISADRLVFSVRVRGDGLGLHDVITSDSELARVRRIDPLRYTIGFEDPENLDGNFDDLVLLVELVGAEVNITEGENFLHEKQVVKKSAVGSGASLSMDLSGAGGAMEAMSEIPDANSTVVTVPGAGLSEDTFAVLTQGNADYYQELLAAPLSAASLFLKLELTNGQTSVAGDPIQIDLGPQVAGAPAQVGDKRLYRYDTDLLSWQELPQTQAADGSISASTDRVGLFALGNVAPAPVTNWTGSANLSCGTNAGTGSASMMAALLLPFAIYFGLRRFQKSRQE